MASSSESSTPEPRGERVGLVLAGGGVRGAYETGALSVLLPELERVGHRPSVIVGTSVGALSAAVLAAHADRPALEAVEAWEQRWLELSFDRIVRPLVGRHMPQSALHYAGGILGVPGARLRSLLDPEPLRATLDGWIDWPTLRRNVARERVVLGVVATAAATQRSVVFLEQGGPAPPAPAIGIDYVATRLTTTHLRASAAIPIVFPAEWVEDPPSAAGWYFDGGTRLNAPLKPVLDLGVDRVVVVTTHPVDPTAAGELGRGRPSVTDGADELLSAALGDPLVHDLRMLGKVNLLVSGEAGDAYRRWRGAWGKPAYRTVPYVVVAPRRRGQLARLACETADEHYGGAKALRSPDLALIRRLIGGDGVSHGELLSYVLFAPEYAAALIEAGRRDAGELLRDSGGVEGIWRTEPVAAQPH